MLKPRNYRYKGANTTSERNRFWLMIVIAVAIMIALSYLF
jgi:hypothetical protein